MILNSIRWRLQLWHGVILVLVLAGFGVTAYQVARDNQFRRIDQELDQHLMILLRPKPPMNAPPENRRPEPYEIISNLRAAIQKGAAESVESHIYYVVLWGRGGAILDRSTNAPQDVPEPEPSSGPAPQIVPAPEAIGKIPPLRPEPPRFLNARSRGEHRELWRFLPQGECVLLGRSLAPDLAGLRRLAFWLLTAGIGVLAMGLAGGWWLASRAIRPIAEISATAVKISGDDLSQRINVADTESELGHLATVLNSTFARLEKAFAQQAQFTADASHELRTPVSVILTQTQTALSRERASAEYREALEACERAAQRMRKLTESLLELARLDAGRERLKSEPFDLDRVARECGELLRPFAAERGLEYRIELSPARCLGDAERVGQVVTNLVTNAIQFNRDGGKIQLATRSENGAVVLSVSDTGPGIPPEDLPHVFERFYRVDKSRSSTRGHAGLGLAICKAIVDAHGGEIAVGSKLGEGSTFTVTLPVTDSGQTSSRATV